MTAFIYIVTVVILVCGICRAVRIICRDIAASNVRTLEITISSENDAEFLIRSLLERYPRAQLRVHCADDAAEVVGRLNAHYRRLVILPHNTHGAAHESL